MIYCAECRSPCKEVRKRLGAVGATSFSTKDECEMITVSDCCEADIFELIDVCELCGWVKADCLCKQ